MDKEKSPLLQKMTDRPINFVVLPESDSQNIKNTDSKKSRYLLFALCSVCLCCFCMCDTIASQGSNKKIRPEKYPLYDELLIEVEKSYSRIANTAYRASYLFSNWNQSKSIAQHRLDNELSNHYKDDIEAFKNNHCLSAPLLPQNAPPPNDAKYRTRWEHIAKSDPQIREMLSEEFLARYPSREIAIKQNAKLYAERLYAYYSGQASINNVASNTINNYVKINR